MAIHIDIKL